MARLVGRYALLALALLALNFLLPRLLPGDPFESASDENGEVTHARLPADARARLRQQYRVDEPLAAQAVGYLGDLARLDLGRSIARGAAVSDLIVSRLPWTLGLLGVAAIVAAAIGTLLGVVGAWRGGRHDAAILVVSSALAALPELLVALGLLVLLAVGAGWFPLHGGRTPFPEPGAGPLFALRQAADVAWHLTLPALALVLTTTASFALVARAVVRAELGRPYLTVALGKGLAGGRILRRHLLPNAALPLVTLFGLRVGQILGGAVVVERVFAVPGLGLLAFEAVRTRDLPVLQAVFLLAGLGVLAVQFAVELVARTLAPRHGA